MPADSTPGSLEIRATTILLRRVMFSGILCAIGVIVGWLFYFAVQAGSGVFWGAALGALVAVIVESCVHYIRVARHEARQGSAPQLKDDHQGDVEPERAMRPQQSALLIALRSGGIVLAFAGTTSVHLASELARDLIRPCIISFVTLVPIGMIFGLVLNATALRIPRMMGEGWQVLLVAAPFVGTLCSVASALVNLGMGIDSAFWGAWGWWTLTGAGISFSCLFVKSGEPTPWTTVMGVAAAASVVLLVGAAKGVATRPLTIDDIYKGMHGYSRDDFVGNFVDKFVTPPVGRLMFFVVEQSLVAPDLPAQEWIGARRRWVQRHSPQLPDAGVPEIAVSRYGARLAKYLQCPEASNDVSTHQDMYVCNELRAGLDSALTRSWMVLVVFGIGLGSAPFAARWTQPASYAQSRTRKNDRLGMLIIAAVMVLGILCIRWKIDEHIKESRQRIALVGSVVSLRAVFDHDSAGTPTRT